MLEKSQETFKINTLIFKIKFLMINLIKLTMINNKYMNINNKRKINFLINNKTNILNNKKINKNITIYFNIKLKYINQIMIKK